jgi:hypothetical protein
MPEGKSLGDLIAFYWENKDKSHEPENRKNEHVIINQIIQECGLGLNENASLTQVTNRINQLIAKPPVQPNDTLFGESLEKIIEIDLGYLVKNLGLNSSDTDLLKRADNYTQLAQLRNGLVKAYYEAKSSTTTLPTQPTNKAIGEQAI